MLLRRRQYLDCMTIKITIEFYISSRFPLRVFGQTAVIAKIRHWYIVDLQFHSDVVESRSTLNCLKFVFARPAKTCIYNCLLSNFLNTRIFLILRWNNVVISISCPKIQGRWMCSSQTFEFSFVSLWSSNQLMANPQSWWNCNNKKGVKIRKGRA